MCFQPGQLSRKRDGAHVQAQVTRDGQNKVQWWYALRRSAKWEQALGGQESVSGRYFQQVALPCGETAPNGGLSENRKFQ